MPTNWKTGSLIALLVILCACASTTSAVRVDKAEDVDLTKCRSFDWLQPGDAPASFTDQRVRAAALAELERTRIAGSATCFRCMRGLRKSRASALEPAVDRAALAVVSV
jgi:hypothetical protein